MQDFQPQFISTGEFSAFGLPDATQMPKIVTLVQRASTLIDEFCGRNDVDGNGSLAYSTYVERILMPVGRNIFRLSFRPLAVVPTLVQQQLLASGSQDPTTNNFYTGFQPSTSYQGSTGNLTPVISASGRYGYRRRGEDRTYPDMNYMANILQIASFFGGPPAFTPIDVTMIDYDPRTGECWVPTGLYLSQYSEIVVVYNSGFDPRHVPRGVKHATASVVHNLMSRGGGATGLKSMGVGKVRVDFESDLIDDNVKTMLLPYSVVRGA